MKAYFYSININKLPDLRAALKDNDNLSKVLKKKAFLLDTHQNIGKYLLAALFYLQEVEEMDTLLHSEHEDWNEIFFEVTDGTTFIFTEKTKKTYGLATRPDKYNPEKLAKFYHEYSDESAPIDGENMITAISFFHKNLLAAEGNRVVLLLVE